MNTRFLPFATAIIGAALSQNVHAQSYEFTEVPTGLSLFASPTIYSVTDTGSYLVVLSALTGPGSAFVYDGRRLVPVQANPGDFFLALNGLGYLVGYGNNGPFLQDHRGNQTTLTDPDGNSIAGDNLNNLNVVVGQGDNAQAIPFGFLWNHGTVTEYSYPGASMTIFNGNNDFGDEVGNFTAASDGSTYAFVLRKSGKTSLITVPNYSQIYPAMINDFGFIAGSANNYSSIGQVGWYMHGSGTPAIFDYGDSAPVAMPGPKGPLMLQKFSGATNVWGVNNLGWLCGSYVSSYEDAVGGYPLAIPFVGKPLGY